MDTETEKVPVSQARDTFADLVNRALYRGETITITRKGKPVAVIAPAPKEDQ